MRVMDQLRDRIRAADIHNPDVQVAPAVILWPDLDGQWGDVIPVLQQEMPELFVLGDYAPEQRRGPAIWLRCVIADQIESVSLPEGLTPVIYISGFSRQDLRAVENCPDELKPLLELQYRGVIWSQINTKDWTTLAFLKSGQGGLGLDVAQDNATKEAMQRSLPQLIYEDISLLEGKRLDRDYFNSLFTGDPIRDLLQWLDQGDSFRKSRDENEWQAFVEIIESQLQFNPQNEGVLTGAEKLANHEGVWRDVWERYCEAPERYHGIPAQIRRCMPPHDTIVWHLGHQSVEGWPQCNEEMETGLRGELLQLDGLPAHEARERIISLEDKHKSRRSLIWARLGEAPLAFALEHLASMAQNTSSSLPATSIDDLEEGYRLYGWRVDDAVLRALAAVQRPDDVDAVIAAVRAVYLPWLEDSARSLQNLVADGPYPGGRDQTSLGDDCRQGDCVLFVDGLRFDTAKRLGSALTDRNLNVSETSTWAALPSLTATGKPAVSPVRGQFIGAVDSPDFEPYVTGRESTSRAGHHLKRLLADAGWSLLDTDERGDGQGMAWCEFGDLDGEGHHRGWKLAWQIDALIRDIGERISSLLAAGWKRVRVVTDHGWLLLPGGLPKTELPSVLTENKWRRFASLKPGVRSDELLLPWYWNPNRYVALAAGVSCYRRGEDYAHGGLSLQECLTLQLTVTADEAAQVVLVKISDIVWRGLRCQVFVDGDYSGIKVDIRSQAGNPSTSVVLSRKEIDEEGTASVIVEDEDLEGEEASIVLLDASGALVAQISTVIGGGRR
ncbi:MAG: BREX-1 system phosphatase PglZ type B [Bacillota bacterium]|nr:BREX-1 system phosphatase PglZ type B [Bacillota bacterium]